MKQVSFLFTVLFFINSLSFSQSIIDRGAEPGELYLATYWYGIYNSYMGPPYYDKLRTAVYRITENGKKLTVQYDADYFTTSQYVMQPYYILADATPGVLYDFRISDFETYTQLWVSFDYGKNWTHREYCTGMKGYCAANVEGLIHRHGTDGAYRSEDYGNNFLKVNIAGSAVSGLQEGEAFALGGIYVFPYHPRLHHTYNFYETDTQVPIDNQFVYGEQYGVWPDVYRGGKEGEVYIDSWFPYYIYKVSFSADTGRTFRHVYVSDTNAYQIYSRFTGRLFMSDREPGVFYILRLIEVESTDSWGWHLGLCIEYYRDYGEILEATFCYDLNKDYEYKEVLCEHTTSLHATVATPNSIQLQWVNSAEDIRGYHVFRNNVRITNTMLTEATYLDENLPVGNYEYYVKTYYKEDCVSDSSNHVREKVELGIKDFKDFEDIFLYPNPTNGELKIKNYELKIENVDIYDVYGRNVLPHTAYRTPHMANEHSRSTVIDISGLQAGIYFVRIATERGVVMRKVVKY